MHGTSIESEQICVQVVGNCQMTSIRMFDLAPAITIGVHRERDMMFVQCMLPRTRRLPTQPAESRSISRIQAEHRVCYGPLLIPNVTSLMKTTENQALQLP